MAPSSSPSVCSRFAVPRDGRCGRRHGLRLVRHLPSRRTARAARLAVEAGVDRTPRRTSAAACSSVRRHSPSEPDRLRQLGEVPPAVGPPSSGRNCCTSPVTRRRSGTAARTGRRWSRPPELGPVPVTAVARPVPRRPGPATGRRRPRRRGAPALTPPGRPSSRWRLAVAPGHRAGPLLDVPARRSTAPAARSRSSPPGGTPRGRAAPRSAPPGTSARAGLGGRPVQLHRRLEHDRPLAAASPACWRRPAGSAGRPAGPPGRRGRRRRRGLPPSARPAPRA